jgi:hypothetical protein
MREQVDQLKKALTATRDQWQSDCVELAGAVQQLADELTLIGGPASQYCAMTLKAKAHSVLERVKGDE